MEENEEKREVNKEEIVQNEAETVTAKEQSEEVIEETKKEEVQKETVRIAEVVGGDKIGLKNNSLGLVSFIFSLMGLLIMGIPFGIVAVVTGIISIVKFNQEEEKNKWMGIAGLCVGAADILLVLYYIVSSY